MRAMLLHAPRHVLRAADTPTPAPGPGEVLVAPLERANEALENLRAGKVRGAAVLQI